MINKNEFNHIVVPMVRSYKQAYDMAANDFIAHTLAIECLTKAVGPELDAKTLSDMARKLETWVTLPGVGFVPLVLRTGSTLLRDRLAGSKTPSILGEAVNELKSRKLPHAGIDRGLVTPRLKFQNDRIFKDLLQVQRLSRLRIPSLKKIPVSRTFDPTGALNLGFKILVVIGPLLGALQMRQARLMGLDTKIVTRQWTSRVGQILELAKSPEQLKKAYEASLEQLDGVWAMLVQSVWEMDCIREELGLGPVMQ